jgi:hypothetical protein
MATRSSGARRAVLPSRLPQPRTTPHAAPVPLDTLACTAETQNSQDDSTTATTHVHPASRSRSPRQKRDPGLNRSLSTRRPLAVVTPQRWDPPPMQHTRAVATRTAGDAAVVSINWTQLVVLILHILLVAAFFTRAARIQERLDTSIDALNRAIGRIQQLGSTAAPSSSP